MVSGITPALLFGGIWGGKGDIAGVRSALLLPAGDCCGNKISSSAVNGDDLGGLNDLPQGGSRACLTPLLLAPFLRVLNRREGCWATLFPFCVVGPLG